MEVERDVRVRVIEVERDVRVRVIEVEIKHLPSLLCG